MKSRITISVAADGGLEIWLNEEGRDSLVRELQNLSPQNDHFHLGPVDLGEVELSSRPYRTNDKLIEFGKVLFRTDEWDRQYYPHVLSDAN
ncbi:MAG TPA: hypothetical protein VHD95_02495 [Rhizomicrobium sp.]|jgi:hypothetical protein|nr:hypothetical protein [Rhizomicrobium sp.]